MSQSVDIHTLAGAYALDALTEIERAAFARHLAGCDACAVEVAGLTETATRLAALDVQAPPTRLRDAVLNEVYRTRQVPAARGGPAGRGGVPARNRWLAAVAAAVVGLAGMAGVFAVQEGRLAGERGRVEDLLAQQAQITAVLSAADASVRSAQASGGGRVTVVVAPSRGDGVVLLNGLRQPAPDRAYQLWLIADGIAASAGVLTAGAASGTALLQGVGGADTLGVTLEPAGGSPAPTTPVLAGIDLT